MFDWYVFADYSGSSHPAEQRKRIALSIKAGQDQCRTSTGWTRSDLTDEIMKLLVKATDSGKRMVFGFDHNYSFPIGFYETLSGKRWTNWRQVLTLISEGLNEFPSLDPTDPRQWAMKANRKLRANLKTDEPGPFWGPHFKPLKKPDFPFGNQLKERRLVEERCKRMKAIYQLGGAGAVGLQSLLGLFYLNMIIDFCEEKKIPLHVWPFDGIELPERSHVLVEMYPTLFNRMIRSDLTDAKSCVNWLVEEDRSEGLINWFSPKFSEIEVNRVRLEGWCLGI